MNKIKVDLQNCFGIEKLSHEFDFSSCNTVAVYAQNGVMKTSFAKTFSCIQGGAKELVKIKDHIFNSQPVKYKIEIDSVDASKDDVFVIKSFESKYQSDSLANLLLNDEYKNKLKDVINKRDSLLKSLTKKSGIKDIENRIIEDFGWKNQSLLENLEDIVISVSEGIFSEITYSDIFDMEDKIATDDFQSNIALYIEESKKIFDDSQFSYLSKGKFSFAGLKNIQKSLDKENFFSVQNNKILLAGNEKTKDDFDKEIDSIQKKLHNSQGLKKIEGILSSTEKGKILQLCIENNPDIIENLEKRKLGNLRKLIWTDYLNSSEIKPIVDDLIKSYKTTKVEINDKNIDEMPRKKALDIFNSRFTVPFDMEIENKMSVMTGINTVPKVIFKFYKDGNKFNSDTNNIKIIDRGELDSIDTLSQGEKRALYLLNIIFDIEKIKIDGRPRLIIVDDIADSFDYKNKYAIIEYLREMQEYKNTNSENIFYQIILSHNFDFYRTVSSRLNIKKRENRLHAEKNKNSETILCSETYQGNPFETWKETMKPCEYYRINYDALDAKKHIIALIPFVRNLIQFGKNNQEHFLLLTHLLHKKESLDYIENGKPHINCPSAQIHFNINATEDITFQDLHLIYGEYLGKNDFDPSIFNLKIYDEIFTIANGIQITDSKLENKIILAMAIRLLAENHMIKQINNIADINKIEGSQTWKLFQKYTGGDRNKKILNSVNIITPENIHLNSFMYEPILDMGMEELINLYKNVSGLV